MDEILALLQRTSSYRVLRNDQAWLGMRDTLAATKHGREQFEYRKMLNEARTLLLTDPAYINWRMR